MSKDNVIEKIVMKMKKYKEIIKKKNDYISKLNIKSTIKNTCDLDFFILYDIKY